MKVGVWVLSLNFLHVFTLCVIDIHKNMLISLFPTSFGHFQFLGSAGQNPKLILTLCHVSTWLLKGTRMKLLLPSKHLFYLDIFHIFALYFFLHFLYLYPFFPLNWVLLLKGPIWNCCSRVNISSFIPQKPSESATTPRCEDEFCRNTLPIYPLINTSTWAIC